ncbi:MAG: hypothetical protein GC159_18135 [Phycisphaera sp.]|nr:hypothetical protein [Phycisphaera sp.]
MRKFLIKVMLLMFVLVVGVALTFYYYGPWLGILSITAAMVLGVRITKHLAVTGIKRFAVGMFTAKSMVLRGATAVVHSVEIADAPDYGGGFDGDDAEPDGPRRYYRIDVTITPKPQRNTPFGLWEPAELTIVPGDTEAIDLDTLSNLETAGDDVEGCGQVVDVIPLAYDGAPMPTGPARDIEAAPDDEPVDEALDDESDATALATRPDAEVDQAEADYDDGGKVGGEMRLALVVAVPASADGPFKFRYYFEDFGAFELPVASSP